MYIYKTISQSIIIFSFFLVVSISNAKDNEFDKVCSYFQALEKEKNVNTLTKYKRNDYILENIYENLKENSNARAAWISIGSAVAEKRYELYKSAAESVLKTKWHCKAMKKLAPITGEF